MVTDYDAPSVSKSADLSTESPEELSARRPMGAAAAAADVDDGNVVDSSELPPDRCVRRRAHRRVLAKQADELTCCRKTVCSSAPTASDIDSNPVRGRGHRQDRTPARDCAIPLFADRDVVVEFRRRCELLNSRLTTADARETGAITSFGHRAAADVLDLSP